MILKLAHFFTALYICFLIGVSGSIFGDLKKERKKEEEFQYMIDHNIVEDYKNDIDFISKRMECKFKVRELQLTHRLMWVNIISLILILLLLTICNDLSFVANDLVTTMVNYYI